MSGLKLKGTDHPQNKNRVSRLPHSGIKINLKSKFKGKLLVFSLSGKKEHPDEWYRDSHDIYCRSHLLDQIDQVNTTAIGYLPSLLFVFYNNYRQQI